MDYQFRFAMHLYGFSVPRVVTTNTIIPMHSRRSETAYQVARCELVFRDGEAKGDGDGEGKIKARGTRARLTACLHMESRGTTGTSARAALQ